MTEQPGKSETKCAQYRSLLCKLPGVYASAVLEDADGAVREIHIVASNARNPKQINRDVQSALLAAFDLSVDHRIISIAQIGANPFPEGDASPNVPDGHPGLRLQCVGVQSGVEAESYHVRVHLKAAKQDLCAEASCRNTPTQRQQAAAQATLSAVHAYMNRERFYTLIATQATSAGGIPIAVTVLESSDGRDERLLIGAAQQGDDPATGFVKSTLDALNRCLAKELG